MKHLRRLLIFTLILGTTLSNAQGKEPLNPKIKAFKTGLITNALSLTPEQAQKFWPIYNQYNDQIMQLMREHRQAFRDIQPSSIDSWSDAAVEKTLKSLKTLKQREFELIEQMTQALEPVISQKQQLQLFLSEEEFRRQLMDRIHRRGAPGNGKGGNDHSPR